MFLRLIVFFLTAKLVFVQATDSSDAIDLGDHQDLDLEFKLDMTSKDLLNYCYSHSTFRRTKLIPRQSLLYNSSQNSEDTVRVLQWNVLSQTLTNGDFSSCPTEALLWVNRRCQILDEILAFKSDVMCFQEVDHFDFFSRALATQSYSGVFLPKIFSPCIFKKLNNGPDGCAIFYNHQKYQLLGKHELVYFHSAENSSSRHVALLIVLKNKSSLNKLCVATTHLKAEKSDRMAFLRNQQGEELLNFVTQYTSDCPTVIIGDFNGEPTEAVYTTMISDPQLNLKSAYNTFNKEPEFTTLKIRNGREIKRTIDYIFYTTKYLTVSGIVAMPRKKSIGKNRIPSFTYPSDHFSLVADLFFNKP